jgi:hypothetical protein
MKALKITGIVVLSIIAITVIALAAMSPRSHMERSVVINAQPAAVYEELISFKNINTWSPWFKLDPNMKLTYEGPEAGVGAKMTWDSQDPNVGKGAQWIMEAEENRRVKSGMNFGAMEGNFVAEFILEPTPEGTKVTWTYDGDVSNTPTMNAAFGKFFGAFTDSMLGPSYEQGLDALKRKVESKPQPEPQQEAPAEPTQP